MTSCVTVYQCQFYQTRDFAYISVKVSDLKQFFAFMAVLAGLTAFGATAGSAGMAAPEIRAPVEKLHAALLDVMKKAETQDVRARFRVLQPILAVAFDMRLMTALSTGSHWRKASGDDQLKLIAAFQRFSAATYASRFDGWSGQSFETLAVMDGPRGTKLVQTRINRPSEAPVPLTYVVRKNASQWQVVDILLDAGISEISVRRSEYRSILKSDGIQALSRILATRADKLLSP
jgi:phospholipid transport system substrate-binding protein